MKNNFQKVLFLVFFMTFSTACKEANVVQPNFMIKVSQIKLHAPETGAPEVVNSFLYNSKLQKIFFSVMPTNTKGKTIFSFPFKESDPENLKTYLESFNVESFSVGPQRQIQSSRDGTYMVFVGWNGNVHIFKNGQNYFNSKFQFDISSVAFGGGLLALGDEKGQIYFFNLAKKKLFDPKRIIDGEIASIAWFKKTQFIVAGNGDLFFVMDGATGETIRSVKLNKSLDDVLAVSGIQHCFENRVNKVLYVAKQNLVLTSQGGDYCAQQKVKIWKADTWELVHTIKEIKFQVHQMSLGFNNNEALLIDYDENLWRFDLNKFRLSKPLHLPKSIYFFDNHDLLAKMQASKIPFGKVNSISLIPNTNILVMALGSFFKAGPGLLMSRLNEDSIQHMTFSEYYRGDLNLYVAAKEMVSKN